MIYAKSISPKLRNDFSEYVLRWRSEQVEDFGVRKITVKKRAECLPKSDENLRKIIC